MEEHAGSGQSAPLPEPIAQFYRRYPTGSLTAELVQIHDAQLIVRASVQINGQLRATGMAAATTIEAAEDQARLRALALLAGSWSPLMTGSSFSDMGSELNGSTQISPMSDPLASPPDWSDTDALASLDSDLPSPVAPVPDREPEPNPAPSLKPKRRSSSTHSADPSPSPDQNSPASEPAPSLDGQTDGQIDGQIDGPIDLSDVIAQTAAEMKRLGWDEQQGREYLQATFGKRSRQHLTDEELLAFRNYLVAQP